MSFGSDDFGDLTAAAGGNPQLHRTLQKLTDNQRLQLAQQGNVANSVPPACPFSITGTDGTFVAVITNPQNIAPFTPAQRRKFNDGEFQERFNPKKFTVVHQLQSSLTRLFDVAGNVKTYGPDPKVRWDIADSPNENRYWRLRSSYDGGVNFNQWTYFLDPIVCGVGPVWSGQVRSTSIVPNAQLNTTNFAKVDSIDNGSTATIRIYGAAGGVGTSWNRQVGSTIEGPFPSGSLAGWAYTTDYWVYYDAPTTSFKVYTAAQFTSQLADMYRFCGKVTTVAAGGAGGVSGGGDITGGRTGCTEVGTELVFSGNEEVEIIVQPCSEWYALSLPGREPLKLAKNTLVKVWMTVQEIEQKHRIAIDGKGDWQTGGVVEYEERQSWKQVPAVRPTSEYRAKKSGIELHNRKPEI